MPGANRFAGVLESAVGSTMRPGDPGTTRLRRDWGDRLVSVRYRYTAAPPTRYTTVEIVVDAAPWKISPKRLVLVDVRSWESEIRKTVAGAGGRWEPKARAWRLRYDKAIALGLGRRLRLTAPGHAPRTSLPLPTRTSLQKPIASTKIGRDA